MGGYSEVAGLPVLYIINVLRTVGHAVYIRYRVHAGYTRSTKERIVLSSSFVDSYEEKNEEK